MILKQITRYAESAATRYTMLTDSFRSIYHRCFNEADFGSYAQSIRMVNEAYSLAQVYIEDEFQTIGIIVDEIALEARRATHVQLRSSTSDELSERTREHLTSFSHYLRDEIIAQIHRDVAQLRQSLQRAALEVSVAARSQGKSERVALIEYRIGNQAETLSFTFTDRVSRRWSSTKFIRAVWRQTLLSTYNEMVMITLSEHGITEAVVYHEDPGSQYHSTRISFGSNTELPTYSEVRDGIFHPNSNAILIYGGADVYA